MMNKTSLFRFTAVTLFVAQGAWAQPSPAPTLPPEITVEAQPQGPRAKVEIIVDSSGSMAQPLDGSKSKMYYSKKLMKTYLTQQWKEKAIVSMRVYGSRRKKDCGDNFLSVPFNSRSLTTIERKIAAMSPVGMTPISESIEMAIKDLKDYKGPKRIVLFTDGEETCGGDPCKVVDEVKAHKNMDLKFYVVAIGFEPGSESIDRLKCIGDTMAADSEDDLFESLGSISKEVDSRTKNLFVKSPKPTANVNLYKILPNGKKKYVKTFAAALGTKVPPGLYSAEVILDPKYEFKSFSVPKGRSVTLTVNGYGEVLVQFQKGLINAELLDKNGKLVHKLVSDKPFLAKTGRYQLRIFSDPFFSRLIKKFYVFPKGHHRVEVGAAAAIQFSYPQLVGLHVYDSNDKPLGNFLTNMPFVLKTGSYKFYVNDQCMIRNKNILESSEIQSLTCEAPPKKAVKVE